MGHSNGWDCLACAVLSRTALLYRAQLCAIFSLCLPSAHAGATACATPAHTWVGLT